jgi:hypothetical protein
MAALSAASSLPTDSSSFIEVKCATQLKGFASHDKTRHLDLLPSIVTLQCEIYSYCQLRTWIRLSYINKLWHHTSLRKELKLTHVLCRSSSSSSSSSPSASVLYKGVCRYLGNLRHPIVTLSLPDLTVQTFHFDRLVCMSESLRSLEVASFDTDDLMTTHRSLESLSFLTSLVLHSDDSKSEPKLESFSQLRHFKDMASYYSSDFIQFMPSADTLTSLELPRSMLEAQYRAAADLHQFKSLQHLRLFIATFSASHDPINACYQSLLRIPTLTSIELALDTVPISLLQPSSLSSLQRIEIHHPSDGLYFKRLNEAAPHLNTIKINTVRRHLLDVYNSLSLFPSLTQLELISDAKIISYLLLISNYLTSLTITIAYKDVIKWTDFQSLSRLTHLSFSQIATNATNGITIRWYDSFPNHPHLPYLTLSEQLTTPSSSSLPSPTTSPTTTSTSSVSFWSTFICSLLTSRRDNPPRVYFYVPSHAIGRDAPLQSQTKLVHLINKWLNISTDAIIDERHQPNGKKLNKNGESGVICDDVMMRLSTEWITVVDTRDGNVDIEQLPSGIHYIVQPKDDA